jgi:aminopeptidase N
MVEADLRDQNFKIKYLKDYKKPDFSILTANLLFDIRDNVTHVTSILTIKRQSKINAPLILNGIGLKLVSVQIGGQVVEYSVGEDTLTLSNVPDDFELTIRNDINPAANTALEGLYLSNGMYCTQCEAQGFRRITYFIDRPDVMACYTVRIEADNKKYPVLLSNGNNISQGKLPENRHFVEWHDPFPKPSYLFALVAGDLDCLEDKFITKSGIDVALRIFAKTEDLDKCTHAMVSLKSSMKWDEDVYGLEYDLNVFNIVAVSHFNMGAMENKSLNIFNTKYILAKAQTATDADFSNVEAVVAHEYFHNWTGNRVTCRDWFQLSLKEGLTVFRDHEFSADMGSRAVTRIDDVRVLRQHQFAEDSGPMAHPVRPESYMEINNFYTVTIYEKGSEVIRMIHSLLGPDKYRKGTDLYFDRHDGQAVTCEDFICAMEDGSGVDLSQFRLWYSQAGTPSISVKSDYNAEAKKYSLTFNQSIPATPGQLNKKSMHIPVAVGLLNRDGQDLLSPGTMMLNIKEAEQTFVFDNITEKPIPSILRGFSAPIKLTTELNREEQIFLIGHDTDNFNKWESAQHVSSDIILAFANDLKYNNKLVVDPKFIDAMQQVLNDARLDNAFKGEMLTLPSEVLLGQRQTPVDVDGIHQSRDFVRTQLAIALRDDLHKIYNECQTDERYHYNPDAVGKRRLKNMSLSYLMELGDTEIIGLCLKQFKSATNMTDEMAAFGLLVDSNYDNREKIITHFYDKWCHDPLVIDKWFSVQAMANRSDVIDTVQALRKHDDFDLKTPNRIRALVSAFCANQVAFHDQSGRGYEFLGTIVKELDPLNPHISSGLAKILTRWKSFDQIRQKLMVATLEDIIKQKGLSKHCYEVVSKSLN